MLLEVGQPGFEEARDFLGSFCELEKAPEHVHFYRITAISVWNAAAAGFALAQLLEGLAARSRFPLPPELEHELRDWYRRYGLLKLVREDGRLLLRSEDQDLLGELAASRSIAGWLRDGPEGDFLIDEAPQLLDDTAGENTSTWARDVLVKVAKRKHR